MGIEPTRPAWKAGILPLNYTRKDVRSHVLEYYIIRSLFCQYLFMKKIFFLKIAICLLQVHNLPL